MPLRPCRILLTGLPGCGKTTAVMQIVSRLNPEKAAGFYTREIRRDNMRKGFVFKCLDGSEGILAHVGIKGPFRVGRYGVDVEGFERFAVPVLDIEQTDARLFVIDEVGKMECLSEKFVQSVRRLFESDRSVLATVVQRGSGLISELKNYPGIKLYNLTGRNRDETAAEILGTLSFLTMP